MGKIGNILSITSFILVFVFLFILAILVTVINSNIGDLSDVTTNPTMFKTVNSVRNWTWGLWITVVLALIVVGIISGILIYLYQKKSVAFSNISGAVTGSTFQTILPIASIIFLILFNFLLLALIVYVVIWYRAITSSNDYKVYQAGCQSISDTKCNEVYSNIDTVLNSMIFSTILSGIAIVLSIVGIVFLIRNRNN
jgi:hypothetical protein